MKAHVTHINLLQQAGPAHPVGWALVAIMAVTLGGLLIYGKQVWAQAAAATQRRDAVALQIKDVQARLAAVTGEQTRNAKSLALRQDVEALQLRVQAAQGLAAAVRSAEGGRAEEFARTLDVATRLNEQGLWLTQLNLSSGGKRLELQGEAHSGAPVLRYARRINEALQPVPLRLDALEMQPSANAAAAAAAAAAAPAAGPTPAAAHAGVSFRLY